MSSDTPRSEEDVPRCAGCGRPFAPEDFDASAALPDQFPFCSERCRMVDLGHWLNEDYKISRDLTSEDVDDGTWDAES